MTHHQMDTHHNPLGGQMATGQDHGKPGKTLELSEASPVEFAGDQGCARMREICNIERQFGLSKAQRISVHAEALRRKDIRDYEAGVVVQMQVRRHICKSLPKSPRAKKTTLRGFLFAVHYRVAELAFRQALRSAHQLHLKRLVDTQGFVEDHCGWYQTFCSLMGWVYAAAGLNVKPKPAVQSTVPNNSDSED